MLILASASPRRSEILANAGVPFVRNVPPFVDETRAPGEPAIDYVMRLARHKAESITIAAGFTVLGADTTVVVDGEILGKPADGDDASRMLQLLSGRVHEVITGICLKSDTSLIVDAASTRVWFTRLENQEIRDYVDTGEPMDKAGAYAIQGLASKYIPRIEGCYFNVVGLPIALLHQHLRAAGHSWYK